MLLRSKKAAAAPECVSPLQSKPPLSDPGLCAGVLNGNMGRLHYHAERELFFAILNKKANWHTPPDALATLLFESKLSILRSNFEEADADLRLRVLHDYVRTREFRHILANLLKIQARDPKPEGMSQSHYPDTLRFHLRHRFI